MTDGPDPARLAAYLAMVQKKILTEGWIIQGVFPREGDEGIPFGYTTGLTVAGLPELIMSGLPLEYMRHMLNGFAEIHLKEGDGLKPGGTVNNILTFEAVFKVVETQDPPIGFARRLYGRKATALQIVWPDDEGRYPGDEGFTEEQELF